MRVLTSSFIPICSTASSNILYQNVVRHQQVPYIGVPVFIHGAVQREAPERTARRQDQVCAVIAQVQAQAEQLVPHSHQSVFEKKRVHLFRRQEKHKFEKQRRTLSLDEIEAVFAANDEMALGAMEACKAAGREDIKIVGFDASPDAVVAVEAGDMAATIAQLPVKIIDTTIDTAIAYLNGEEVEKEIGVELQLVTQESLAAETEAE